MNIFLYGRRDEWETLQETIETRTLLSYRQKQFRCYDNYDDFIIGMQEESPTLIIVTIDGAEGMEAVIASRENVPQAKVIWFSDDKAFGPQSYRLDCSYFGVKPITDEMLNRAFAQI